jgi:hypothetical protein
VPFLIALLLLIIIWRVRALLCLTRLHAQSRHITGVLIKARIGTQAANAAAAFLNYLPFVLV